MPLYEYRCQTCNAKFSLLFGMTAEQPEEVCPKCGGKKVERLVSRFTRGRTEDQRVDEIADNLERMGEPESPAEMREMVREMGRAMDEDISEDLEEMFETDMEGGGDDDEL